MENCIKITNLSKSYGKIEVLKGVDLTIKSGEIFCLLGSNGAGKTTLVRILSTLLNYSGGSVEVCGHDLKSDPSAVRKSISLTGQFAAIDGMLTGRENLILVAKLLRIPNAKQRAAELLEKFALLDRADSKTSTYSGGMRRRLDLAMSMVETPKLLFLDEPTTGLDPQSRLQLWQIVKSLSSEGVTVFLTTQYLEEAEQLADTVAVLHDGKIVKHGTVKELKKLIKESRIELVFSELDAYETAASRLHALRTENFAETLTISVQTQGEVSELSEILTLLNGVNIDHIEQKRATLEDVFLRLVDKNSEVKNHEN